MDFNSLIRLFDNSLMTQRMSNVLLLANQQINTLTN